MVSQLNFSESKYSTLRMYEKGFVKEGLGAGGCAIAASLYQNWTNQDIVRVIEELL
jgi:NaMN:DMB phosphoribosyltransferase